MKLLFILPEYVTTKGGGIGTFYRSLLPVLAAQGHEVRVIVGSGVTAVSSPKVTHVDGVNVEMLDYALLEKYRAQFTRYSSTPGLQRFLAATWAIWEQAGQGEGYDLVEATDWGLLFLPWVIEKNIPVIVQLHGSMGQIDLHDPVLGEEVQGNLIRLFEKLGVAQATEVQANSQANAVFWQSQCGKDVIHIPPACAPPSSHIAVERTSRGLVVGRVQRWKGPEVLCQALRLLSDRGPNIDWMGRDTIYGKKGFHTTQHLLETWPNIWGKKLVHIHQQPAKATAHLQGRAKFIVVPSLWDTFNFTCVEAMGAGTPVICSTGAGASELIEDGVNGFVFENGNASSLAEALERLQSLTDIKRHKLAVAGRNTVLNELNPATIAKQRLQAYEAVAHNASSSALPADDWLRQACAPSQSGSESLDFLDFLPLKAIAGYTWRRGMKKILK